MTPNSVPYLGFLAVAVTLFWLLPVRYRRTFVLLASLGFYATWGVALVAVPLSVTVLVYVLTGLIARDSNRARRWVILGVTCTLSLLAFFKYRNFALVNLNAVLVWFHAGPVSFARNFALPLGISFYTFEAIAYMIDVRQGRVRRPGFLDLCLFFMFWPNILAGPIVRARELIPQLKMRANFEAGFMFEGLDRILWGLIQKNVIANTLSIWVGNGFAPNGSALSTTDAWFMACAYALQIYFDFAGYSNIAIGAARLIGITLPENFRQPYHAANPAEFWSRWHMTLSRWIRDYLFFPINAKHKGAPGHLYVSLIGIMALIGLWHGAGWGFMVWGAMHGVYLVWYRMFESAKETRPGLANSRLVKVGWRVFTLIIVIAAWVPFRASTLARASAIWYSMFAGFSRGMAYSQTFYVFTSSVAVFCALEPWILKGLTTIDERQPAGNVALTRVLARPLAYACALLLFVVFSQHNAEFIYFQF